jgi:hypothetical protein
MAKSMVRMTKLVAGERRPPGPRKMIRPHAAWQLCWRTCSSDVAGAGAICSASAGRASIAPQRLWRSTHPMREC